ncbi:MAG: HD domain-containing protein [Oscillospiraceae bacterium]|nr:HD domain-containing protein [Oscillospiraceae bacterium]MBQ2794447.1 HD domain-containing protein [Oscillospiraceae bacterium]MBQ2862528.1 HD domain-containing protein [Oscillospiraceae bacterium]MBQ2998129.1 HD domain-containing protein [Oscillospiraceae bacterium]MBQ3236604.1 HD domain-containing protein [Oscillospiraceae bacterium]
MDIKQEFIDVFKENVKRPGAEKLLEWLCTSDFFTAPASTKYHCAFEGGLALHSLNVYKTLKKRCDEYGITDGESVAICGLLHDVCKANFYTISFRNVKNERGQWEKVPYFAVDDQFPFGHGEKSVFVIERFMRLKENEAIAIRWHMGGFDDTAKAGGFSISHAYEKYPLAVLLHMADLESTYLVEQGENAKH